MMIPYIEQDPLLRPCTCLGYAYPAAINPNCEVHGHIVNTSSEVPPDALRWHMYKYGRTFIMYGEYHDVRLRAIDGGYSPPEFSGHYSYVTNTILGARDGETSFSDTRPSGRFYSK